MASISCVAARQYVKAASVTNLWGGRGWGVAGGRGGAFMWAAGPGLSKADAPY